jgi:hypothetical protein
MCFHTDVTYKYSDCNHIVVDKIFDICDNGPGTYTRCPTTTPHPNRVIGSIRKRVKYAEYETADEAAAQDKQEAAQGEDDSEENASIIMGIGYVGKGRNILLE